MCDLSTCDLDEEQRTSIRDMECPSDSILLEQPWGRELVDSGMELARKSTLIWIKMATVIGDVDVEDYSKRFLDNVDKLYADMILDMETLKEKKLNAIVKLMGKFEATCVELQVPLPCFDYENDCILSDVYKKLQSDFSKFEKEAEERRRRLEKLNRKMAEFARALGRPLELLPEKPLPSGNRMDNFEMEVEKLENERMDRECEFITKRDEFVEMVRELEMAPFLNGDERKLFESEEVAVTDEDMRLLERANRRIKLKKTEIANEIERHWVEISDLWSKLEIDLSEQDEFRRTNGKAANPCNGGVTLKILSALKSERARLEQLKRANLGLFVEKLRSELRQWWEKCHLVETEEIEKFRFFRTDHYNEDLLDLHRLEIERHSAHYRENEEFYKTLQEFSSVWKEMEDLELNSQVTGLNRYKNRGGKLLEEEKTRKRLERKIPNLRRKLLEMSKAYSDEKGADFLTFGMTVEEFIEGLRVNFDRRLLDTKTKLKANNQSVTPSRMNLFGSVADLRSVTPKVSSKRKIVTALTDQLGMKKFKPLFTQKKKATTGNPKLNVTRVKRLSKEKVRRSIRRKLSMKKERDSDKENDTSVRNYNEFMEGVSKLKTGRSTTFNENPSFDCPGPSRRK